MAKVLNPPTDPAEFLPRAWIGDKLVASTGTVVTAVDDRRIKILYDDLFLTLAFDDELPEGRDEGYYAYVDNVATIHLLNKVLAFGGAWTWHNIASTDDNRSLTFNLYIQTVGAEPDKLARLLTYSFLVG